MELICHNCKDGNSSKLIEPDYHRLPELLIVPKIDDVLHVIVPLSNHVRFKRRFELFWKFIRHMGMQPNILLYIVECAFGDRPFVVTEHGNPRHLQLRTNNELWNKENMINLMAQRLPLNWKYMAWIDADLRFDRMDLAAETIHQLQHYPLVQLFATSVNYGPDGEVISTFKGFGYEYARGKKYDYQVAYKKGTWHSGFAWAITREAFTGIGGLPEFGILGAGDHHLALAAIGKPLNTIPKGIHANYSKAVLELARRCDLVIRRNIGYVPGTVHHGWHGTFKARKYCERWKILVDNNFDPEAHLIKDWQGLNIFDSDAPLNLAHQIRIYFRQRNEDTIDNPED